MENKPDFDLDLANKWFGVNYNNGIFPLLEKTDRTDEETEKMIQMAFASTIHWSEFSGCKYANKVRGINMIATALAYAGRKEGSLYYARKNFEMVTEKQGEVEDFDVSFMLMQYARALALNERLSEARERYIECLQSIEKIADAEDKKIVMGDLNSGPWYGLNQ
ncbi:MAG: hypothetical protein IAE90_09095 [Ignavibacteria bacterium]|nr:hypothetical protein [Ignavibacteria bacterium]